MTRQPQRFEQVAGRNYCVDPRAFFELFVVPASRDNELRDGVAIVDVSGPLVQRDELWCDSYEAIRARFGAACVNTEVRAILLRLDSPGGDASGCFETARALREQARLARKPFLAYVDKACSAAYALASSADAIVIGDTCCAGSIGVLSSRPDYTAQNAQRGVRIAFVTSGARKLDGNPDAPITEDELVETQKHVDDLALQFFGLIEAMRPQLPAAAVAGFDGRVFYGNGAVEARLADAVATFDEALALVSHGDAMGLLTALQAKSEYDVARASLAKVAKGSDANAAAAKRALAALDAAGPGDDDEGDDEDKPDAEGDEDKPDAEGDGAKPAAEGDDDKPDAEGGTPKPAAMDEEPPADDKKPKSSAASSAQAASDAAQLDLAARLHKLEAREAARDQRDERARLLASRPDFGPELKASLAKAPIATVRDMVSTLPRKKAKAPITTLPAARGSTQGPAVSAIGSAETLDMDRRMGLTQQTVGCRREGSALIFGVVKDEVPQPSAASGAAK